MHSYRLDQLITPDQEAIVGLAHALCVSERKRMAWEKTAELEQERATDSAAKLRETLEKSQDERVLHARITFLSHELGMTKAMVTDKGAEIRSHLERIVDLKAKLHAAQADNATLATRLHESLQASKGNAPTRQPYEFQVWDCNNVCIEQWGTYDEAVRGAALWETPSSAAPYRVVKVYFDAPRDALQAALDGAL